MKNLLLSLTVLIFLGSSGICQSQEIPPKNRDAGYTGESITLENDHIKMIFYKRKVGAHKDQIDGWSWAELYGPDERGELTKYLGILDHFGEVDMEGHVHPLRMDAPDYTVEEDDKGKKLIFNLDMQIPEEACMVWDNYIAVHGQLSFYLPKDEPVINYHLLVKPDFRVSYRSIRGPWLRIGAFDFGAEKEDAIFPGIEWLVDKQWSSSIDYLSPELALRVSPHPRKVTAPIMAISHDGLAVGLSWDPLLGSVDELNRIHHPQPVFASPNFIDKRDDNLMGLMFPSAGMGMEENSLKASPALRMPRKGIEFDAQIVVVKGTSLDAITNWVQRDNLPDPGNQRFEKGEVLEKIAEAYDSHFWEEGVGWSFHKPVKSIGLFHGTAWYLSLAVNGEIREKPSYYVPDFINYYLETGINKELKFSLKKKVDWCYKQGHFERKAIKNSRINGFPDMFNWYTDKELRAYGDEILEWQEDNGSFKFDPHGRHKTNHGPMAQSYRPLGLPGDSVLDFNMTSSILLLTIGEYLQDENYSLAAKKALEISMTMDRPEGGDWWETPLHSPNYYTAGWGAMAYYLGFQVFGEEKYKERSAHFLKSMLPFTYLWQSDAFPMTYHTNPLFGGTGWRYMAWSDRCVHWQIISLIDLSLQMGIDWSEIDDDIDWDRYQKGAILAGMRLLADHKNMEWRVHSEDVNDEFKAGMMDMFIADTFDPVAFTYGGLGIRIPPDALANCIINFLEE